MPPRSPYLMLGTHFMEFYPGDIATSYPTHPQTIKDRCGNVIVVGDIDVAGPGGGDPVLPIRTNLNLKAADAVEADDVVTLGTGSGSLGDYLRKDGTTPLTGDWSIGVGRFILANTIRSIAASSAILTLNTALTTLENATEVDIDSIRVKIGDISLVGNTVNIDVNDGTEAIDLNAANIGVSGDLVITGDTTTSGTFDGRDVAADGIHLDHFRESWDGATIFPIDIDVTSDGATVTLSFQKSGGGDVDFYFGGDIYTLVTPPATIALTAGTDISPQANYIYVMEAASVLTLTKSTSGFPTTEHAPIATVFCQSAASVQTDGVYKVHAWVDHLHGLGSGGQSHISHINARLRSFQASWISGVAPNNLVSVDPNAYISSDAGLAYQLHRHIMPARDMQSGAPLYLINDPTTAFLRITSIASVTQDKNGAAIGTNKFINLVVMAIINEDEANCKLMANLPDGIYNTEANALVDSQATAIYTIPSDFSGVGILLARYTLKKTAAGWTQSGIEDLRGLQPSTSVGGGGSGSISDHGLLTGLLDDDHTQYLLASGARELSAPWDIGAGQAIHADQIRARAVATSSLDLAVALATLANLTEINADSIRVKLGDISAAGNSVLIDIIDGTEVIDLTASTVNVNGGLTVDDNISQGDAKYVSTDQIRARDGDGLKLYDDGGFGIFVEDGGQVGIGTVTPSSEFNIVGDNSRARVENAARDKGINLGHRTSDDAALIAALGTSNIILRVGGADVLSVESGGHVNISTSATLGKQAVTIDQNDADQAFVDFQGSEGAGVSYNINTTERSTFEAMLMIEKSGTKYWLKAYQ